MRFWLEKLLSLLKVVKELLDQLVLLLDTEDLILLVLLKSRKFFVEVFLQFKNNLLDQLNLVSLPDIGEKLIWLINEFPHLWILIDVNPCLLDILDLEQNLPMHLFHTFDLSGDHLIFIRTILVLITVLLLGLSSKFTFSDL